MLHPTRLAFQGIALLALTGALGAGVFLWITRSPSWNVIASFAVGWLIDALATLFLHRGRPARRGSWRSSSRWTIRCSRV